MSIRTAPDALTIAYIALGARTALQQLPNRIHDKVTGADIGMGGELDTIGEAIEHALALDIAADKVCEEGGFGGCFLYEVAEPFGATYIQALADGRQPEVETIIATLIAACAA